MKGVIFMVVFSISATTTTSEEGITFQRIVTSANEELHKKYKSLHLTCVSDEGTSRWQCTRNEQRPFKKDSLLFIYQLAAKATAGLILEMKEQHIIRALLRDEFNFSGKEESERIIEHCLALLEKGTGSPNPSWNRRYLMLAKSLQKCLLENNILNIDGFISFRLQEYGKELREVVEYAVDEFLVDRQYEEFVGLLKYFVYFQEPQIPLAHVVHKGGQELLLFDENMNPFQLSGNEAVFVERINQQDMEMEDAVVSTLISISPAKLIIHTRDEQMPAVKTLLQIFEKRVEICHYCPECHAFFREKEKI
jgi:putative sporulation protein YtxC